MESKTVVPFVGDSALKKPGGVTGMESTVPCVNAELGPDDTCVDESEPVGPFVNAKFGSLGTFVGAAKLELLVAPVDAPELDSAGNFVDTPGLGSLGAFVDESRSGFVANVVLELKSNSGAAVEVDDGRGLVPGDLDVNVSGRRPRSNGNTPKNKVNIKYLHTRAVPYNFLRLMDRQSYG